LRTVRQICERLLPLPQRVSRQLRVASEKKQNQPTQLFMEKMHMTELNSKDLKPSMEMRRSINSPSPNENPIWYFHFSRTITLGSTGRQPVGFGSLPKRTLPIGREIDRLSRKV
jgi:hypothetical protein